MNVYISMYEDVYMILKQFYFTWLEAHNFILLIRLLHCRCYFLRCLTYGIIWKGFSFKYIPIIPTGKCLEEYVHYRLNISKSPCWPPGWLYAITIPPKQHQVMWYGKTFLACKHCLCIEFKNIWVARMASTGYHYQAWLKNMSTSKAGCLARCSGLAMLALSGVFMAFFVLNHNFSSLVVISNGHEPWNEKKKLGVFCPLWCANVWKLNQTQLAKPHNYCPFVFNSLAPWCVFALWVKPIMPCLDVCLWSVQLVLALVNNVIPISIYLEARVHVTPSFTFSCLVLVKWVWAFT